MTPPDAIPLDSKSVLGHSAWVHELARGLIRDRHLAEDVAQRVLLRVDHSLHSFAAAGPQCPTARRSCCWCTPYGVNVHGGRDESADDRHHCLHPLPS